MFLKSTLAKFLTPALLVGALTAVSPAQGPQLPPVTTIPAMEELAAERTTATARREFLLTERDKIARARFDGPTNVGQWPAALWSAYIVGLDDEQRGHLHTMLRRELVELPDKPVEFQRALLNAAYTFLPGQHRGIVSSPMRVLETPREFAMAGYAIIVGSTPQPRRDLVRGYMDVQFPDWSNDPTLTVLRHRIDSPAEEEIERRPPLADLLAAPFQPGVPILFSLQRLNRHQPGIAIIRDSQGRFHRTDEGAIFSVPQLALSKTNLPGTITYGNSPQGIYTIRGMGRATNPFIGPTPYLWSKVPHEATMAEFLHDDELDAETPWSDQVYLQMLPNSWIHYFPMREAWFAGLAGRSEMIVHGSTLDPEPYAAQPYYPLTPTAGCLSTIEMWNPEDGSLVYSDQLTLLRAFEAAGGPNGYLVLVELDATERPVTITNVIEDILEAERRLQTSAP